MTDKIPDLSLSAMELKIAYQSCAKSAIAAIRSFLSESFNNTQNSCELVLLVEGTTMCLHKTGGLGSFFNGTNPNMDSIVGKEGGSSTIVELLKSMQQMYLFQWLKF